MSNPNSNPNPHSKSKAKHKTKSKIKGAEGLEAEGVGEGVDDNTNKLLENDILGGTMKGSFEEGIGTKRKTTHKTLIDKAAMSSGSSLEHAKNESQRTEIDTSEGRRMLETLQGEEKEEKIQCQPERKEADGEGTHLSSLSMMNEPHKLLRLESPSDSLSSSKDSSPLPPLSSVKSYSDLPRGASTPGNPLHSPPKDSTKHSIVPRKRPQPPPDNKSKCKELRDQHSAVSGLGSRYDLHSIGEKKGNPIGQLHVRKLLEHAKANNQNTSPESAVSAHQHRSRSPIHWFLTETKSTPTSPDAALLAATEVRRTTQTQQAIEDTSHMKSSPAMGTVMHREGNMQSKLDDRIQLTSRQISTTATGNSAPNPFSNLPPLPLVKLETQVQTNQTNFNGESKVFDDTAVITDDPGFYSQNAQLNGNAANGEENAEDETRSEATTTYAISPKSVELIDGVDTTVGADNEGSSNGTCSSKNQDGFFTSITFCASHAWSTLRSFFCKDSNDGTISSNNRISPKDRGDSTHYVQQSSIDDIDDSQIPSWALRDGGVGPATMSVGRYNNKYGQIPASDDTVVMMTEEKWIAPGVQQFKETKLDTGPPYFYGGTDTLQYQHIQQQQQHTRSINTTFGGAGSDYMLASPYTIATAGATIAHSPYYKHARSSHNPTPLHHSPHPALSTFGSGGVVGGGGIGRENTSADTPGSKPHQHRYQTPRVIIPTPAASAWPFPPTTM